MKWYLGNVPIFKLGSIFYWKGTKYKVTSSKLRNANKRPATIGVKDVDNNPSNS